MANFDSVEARSVDSVFSTPQSAGHFLYRIGIWKGAASAFTRASRALLTMVKQGN